MSAGLLPHGLAQDGQLPPGWKWVEMADLILDFQPGFACGERSPTGIVQVRMNNVTTTGSFNWKELTRVPRNRTDLARYLLEADDVLFNILSPHQQC